MALILNGVGLSRAYPYRLVDPRVYLIYSSFKNIAPYLLAPALFVLARQGTKAGGSRCRCGASAAGNGKLRAWSPAPSKEIELINRFHEKISVAGLPGKPRYSPPFIDSDAKSPAIFTLQRS